MAVAPLAHAVAAAYRAAMPAALTVAPRLLAMAALLAACSPARTSPPPSASAATATTATTPIVIGESFTMPARAIGGEPRRINVWLPPRGAGDTARLPVLYMPDGGMQEDFLHIAGLLQVSIGNGTMRPFMLVGIENTQRRRDLTGPTRNARDSTIAPRVGGSAAFRAFIRDELIPEVNRRYPTTAERAIVGESLAGLFVVETLLLEPALFDTYVAFDPSVWWDDARLVHESAARLRAMGTMSTTRKTLWVATSGEREITVLGRRLVDSIATARPAGLVSHYEPMPGEQHSTIFHPAATRAFRAVFAPDTTKR